MRETPGYRQTARRLLAAATLVCGMKMDQLLEQVADGSAAARDAHQRGCPYCQAALGELAVMWAPVAQLAAAPVTSAPGLNASVMSQIRPSGQETWYSVRATNQGVIRVASRVVTVVARDSARLVPGVRIALCRGVRAASAALADRATFRSRPVTLTVPGGAAVDLAVTIGSGRPALDVARDVQRYVTASLRNSLDLDPVTVNVSVDGITGAGPQHPRGGHLTTESSTPVPPATTASRPGPSVRRTPTSFTTTRQGGVLVLPRPPRGTGSCAGSDRTGPERPGRR